MDLSCVSGDAIEVVQHVRHKAPQGTTKAQASRPRKRKRTLGLDEVSLLDAGLQGLVEEVVEHVIGDGDVVVGLDVLLEGWAAGRMLVKSRSCATDASTIYQHASNRIYSLY